MVADISGEGFPGSSFIRAKEAKAAAGIPLLLRRYQISIRHENWVICFLLAGAIVGLTCTSLADDPA